MPSIRWRPLPPSCSRWWPEHGASHTPVCCVPTWPCTRCWGSRAFPSTTPFAICSSASARGSASAFSLACGVGSWNGFRNIRRDTVWTWIRPCSSAMANKHGRPSHHPLVAVLAEAHFLLHGWLRRGNCGTSRGVVEFLKEALALLPEKHALRVVRADAGFFDQQLLGFFEQRGLLYILVARLTLWLKREAARVNEWRALDPHYAVGEFSLQLFGWDRPRRFVVIREQLRAERPSLGRKLLEVPGYTFRVFVTNLMLPPEEIWRDYNL